MVQRSAASCYCYSQRRYSKPLQLLQNLQACNLTTEVVGGRWGGALPRCVYKLGGEAFSVPAIANCDADGAARVDLPVIGLQQGTGDYSQMAIISSGARL